MKRKKKTDMQSTFDIPLLRKSHSLKKRNVDFFQSTFEILIPKKKYGYEEKKKSVEMCGYKEKKGIHFIYAISIINAGSSD